MPNMNSFMVPSMLFYYPGQASYPFGQYPPTPLPIPDKTDAPLAAENPTASPCEYPKVIRWFQLLDDHEEHNKDGINFSQYGAVLEAKGFL